MITCQEVIEYLMAYVNNELSVDERQAMDAHLQVCPACVSFLKTYRQTLEFEATAFNQPEIEEAIPEDLIQAILSARKRNSGS
jgi:anti-sigma factor RsiW